MGRSQGDPPPSSSYTTPWFRLRANIVATLQLTLRKLTKTDEKSLSTSNILVAQNEEKKSAVLEELREDYMRMPTMSAERIVMELVEYVET